MSFKRYVKKVVKNSKERKVYDNVGSTQATNDAIVFDLAQLRNIIPGVQMTNRLGDQIHIEKLHFRGVVHIPDAGAEATVPNCYVRVILFQWFSDPFTDAPDGESIIQSYYSSAGAVTTMTAALSYYNKTNAGKYNILFDKFFTLSTFGPSMKSFSHTCTPAMKTVPYSLTEGAPNYYPNTGNIYMLTISDVDETQFTAPDVDYSLRVVYTD